MQSLLDILTAKFRTAIIQAFPETQTELLVEITPSTQERFGHYQCNSAMKLVKQLRRNPVQIAEALVQHIDRSDKIISKIEIVPPGFINVTLDPAYLGSRIQAILADPHLGIDPPERPQRVVVDFSSPNTAKEMHVGHLRSTIIGDSLARLFEFLGHDVLRLNHVGDWGTSFGMLLAYIKEFFPTGLNSEKSADLIQLMTWYKLAKARFDSDPEFKKRAQMAVVALQGGDPQSLQMWKVICTISQKAYQEIYDLLDVNVLERGESFYNPFLADTVRDLEAKGLIQVSDGAKCFFVKGFSYEDGKNPPLMLQKSDGGYNYDTTDMAALRHRVEVEHADRIICVTDAGQSLHFQMLFKGAEQAGYVDSKVQLDHVPFGLVLGPDGKKFRTRSGETERLIDLLIAAIDKAKGMLKERSPQMSDEEVDKAAKALGIGAVKYADLACHRTSDYSFSYERMLRFEGNTAAFVMYAYVRVLGIKRKVQQSLPSDARIELEHPSEIALGLHLIQFGEVLSQMARDLLPHRLTEYLYGLAEKFNAFFRDCRVEGSAEQNSRLLICEATGRVLRQGLQILGLQTVEKM